MKNIIDVRNLSKNFGTNTAVDNLSFQVGKGEVFGLLGNNGAGKSTTIDCVLGLKLFDQGNAQILGMNPAKERKKVFERVGVQLQHNSFQDKIKVAELCESYAILYQSTKNYMSLLKEFGLLDCKNQYVTTLSGGERQKLSVLLALLPDPEVLFLDELTTGLDTFARREVWKQLEYLKKSGVTMLLTSHYMDEVEVLCDKILIMKNGREIVLGNVADVIRKSPYETMEKAYLWYMGEGEII